MSRDTSRHHRCPSSKGGTRDPKNISIVSSVMHNAWHNLFANLTPYQICYRINSKWLDPDYEFICVKKEVEDDIQR